MLKQRLSVHEPSIMCGEFMYEEGEGLEDDEVAENAAHLCKRLEALPGICNRAYKRDSHSYGCFHFGQTHSPRQVLPGLFMKAAINTWAVGLCMRAHCGQPLQVLRGETVVCCQFLKSLVVCCEAELDRVCSTSASQCR